MSRASGPLEQKEGENTSEENLPAVLEKRWHEFRFTFHARSNGILYDESVYEGSPGFGLEFAVSVGFSLPSGGKSPTASERCWPNEFLVASFCSRWTIRWGTGISIPVRCRAAFTATATSLCTKED